MQNLLARLVPSLAREDPYDGPNNAACIFLIDRTGSMGEWIRAVRAVLPSMIHSVALTNVFDAMAIVTYSDYDMAATSVVKSSGFLSTTNPKDIAKLEKFAADTPCEGGGGWPEAVKSSLLAIGDMQFGPSETVKRIHVIHLTDAPPHCLPASSLDNEGKKERDHLKEMFVWKNVLEKLTTAHPTLRYSALCTRAHPLYCHLAEQTGGDVFELVGGVNAANIRTNLGKMLNGWLGLPEALEGRKVLRKPTNPTAIDSCDEEAIVACAIEGAEGAGDKCAVSASSLMSAVKRMRANGPFREHVIAEMKIILDLDVMALTVSPIVGKLWRELCKSRADPRRDELIEVLNRAKSKLGTAERSAMDEWLKESYNVKAEIDALLVNWMQRNETEGLLRFVPEDDALCAQQVVQLLARGDPKSTAAIRQILCRMFVDSNATVPIMGTDPEATSRTMTATGAPECEITPILRGLSTKPTHLRSALVLLPTATIAAKADRIRKDNDKAFGRWMPHMTLLFPFLAPDAFPDAIDAISAAMERPDGGGFCSPFTVKMDKVSWFPGKRAIMHIEPEIIKGQPNSIEAIYNTLLRMFPHLKRADRDEFHAHMTLGQFAGQEAEKKAATIQSEWGTDDNIFEVNEVHLIAHLEGEESYKIMHSFPLPKKATKGAMAPSPISAPITADALLDDEDEEPEPPLPHGTIPMNLPRERFWELVMHTVAPGTKLTRRYAALLAMHAVMCGSVLAPAAKEYLAEVKGRWINWSRRDDEACTAEVPENFSAAFLYMLTDDAVSECAATEDELVKARFFLRVHRALKFFHQLELPINMLDHSSADGTFPDHDFICVQCSKRRPLCIIAEDGVCGYCKKGKGESTPDMDATAQLQVRCHTCGSFYARDASIRIPGHSKCHGCQKLGTPSPSVQCTVCHNNVVQFYQTASGLPKGGRCGPCAHNLPPRKLGVKEFVALAHQVFAGPSHFENLCSKIGLQLVATPSKKYTGIASSTSIVDAVLWLEDHPSGPQDVAVPLTGVEFREHRPENAAELWDMTAKIMSGAAKPMSSECAVCMCEPEGRNRLVPACGRKGCTQRVCIDCSKQWYGINEPGKVLFPRSVLCQFCARVPAPHVLRAVSPQLLGLTARIRANPLQQDSYYAWCRRCFNPSFLATRECVAAGDEAMPELDNFTCDGCRNCPVGAAIGGGGSPATANTAVFKECPKCSVMTEKESGCNHMECESCSIHWCWQCANFTSEDANEVYEHMDAEHGGIFDFDVEYDDEEEED